MSVKKNEKLNFKTIKAKFKEAWSVPSRRMIMIAIPVMLVIGIIQLVVGAAN